MSEYTSVYLRRKDVKLMEYRNYPTSEEAENLSQDEITKLYNEVEKYNSEVSKSFGCELFYLTTTPSRQLDVLPWTDSPKLLTNNLLDEIVSFYREKIDDYKKSLVREKNTISMLEDRIVKANVELYDRINADINDSKRQIEFCEEEIEEYSYLCSKFEFLQGIMECGSNSELYELIYTKC